MKNFHLFTQRMHFPASLWQNSGQHQSSGSLGPWASVSVTPTPALWCLNHPSDTCRLPSAYWADMPDKVMNDHVPSGMERTDSTSLLRRDPSRRMSHLLPAFPFTVSASRLAVGNWHLKKWTDGYKAALHLYRAMTETTEFNCESVYGLYRFICVYSSPWTLIKCL